MNFQEILKGNFVIRCYTEDEAKRCINELYKEGYSFTSHREQPKTFWNEGFGTSTQIDYYVDMDGDIMYAQDSKVVGNWVSNPLYEFRTLKVSKMKKEVW